MQNLKTKLTSRKFLIAAAGVVSGIVLIANGSVTEGVTSIIASVVAYLAAEGLVDMAAVKKTVGKSEEIKDYIDCGEVTEPVTEDKIRNQVIHTLEEQYGAADDDDDCGMTE